MHKQYNIHKIFYYFIRYYINHIRNPKHRVKILTNIQMMQKVNNYLLRKYTSIRLSC